ncbi:nicotinamide riboside transporter PnuC [Massilia sp. PWRC2]|uniref:nicotinamide riboside transporter PnuC n=1 Tax=Massilia sp. PWRC2 TaxID=2804626 RepID=UPI003CF01346
MTGALEICANVGATLAIWLAGRNSIHTWWTGMLGCALFALLFYQSRLYADVLLQLFFIGSSALGWWYWRRRSSGVERPIAAADFASLAWPTAAALLVAAAYAGLLLHFTDAYAPFIDSAVLALSVLAQLLLMKRRIENWAFWLLVNSLAVPLYASRGLYLTALLYACYWVHALVAWWQWRRLAAAALVMPAPAMAGTSSARQP